MLKIFILSFITLSLSAQTAISIAKESFDKISNYKSSISTTTMIWLH